MQTLSMHIQEPPPVPSTIKKELPIEFDQLVLKMLAKTPEERFESVEEARKALSRLKDSM